MRVLAAIVSVLSLAALGASAATAAPSRVMKLTAAEEKWVTPVLTIWNSMNADLQVVSAQTTAANGLALVPGTKQNKILVTTLGDLVTCTPAMKKAKAPPTERLKPFAATMTRACKMFGEGAHGVANGISSIYAKNDSKLGALQIKQAFGVFAKGSKQLGSARTQLLAVGGKNLFGG